MTINELDISVNGKVFRKDGMDGKITAIDLTKEAKVCIKYFDGTRACLTCDADIDDYYLLGRTVVGNKCSEEYITAEIDKAQTVIDEIAEQSAKIKADFAVAETRTPELYDAYLAKLEQKEQEKKAAVAKRDCLARQRWNLRDRMIPNWKEKQGKK